MRVINDREFIKEEFDKDSIIAFKICENRIYFVGWMEDAEHHYMQIPMDYRKCRLDINAFKDIGREINMKNIYDIIFQTDGYDNMYLFGEGYTSEKQNENPYQEFLSHIESEYLNEHKIIQCRIGEFREFYKLLKNGTYIFMFCA